jgi:hypothetical protein
MRRDDQEKLEDEGRVAPDSALSSLLALGPLFVSRLIKQDLLEV